MTASTDILIVGGGIVGLATARALMAARPDAGVTVLEKETSVACHQTGHNSGVLHSGLYYRPRSLKAQLCVEGRKDMLAYTEEHGIPFKVTGKLVVATRPSQLDALETLHQRGRANGLSGIERLGPEGIRSVEPNATGLAALFVPEAGVVDFSAVARSLADGGDFEVRLGACVRSITATGRKVRISTDAQMHTAGFVVNCAGLHADRVARMAGLEPQVRIIPFRGEYYTLSPRASQMIKALIYPVPDPRFPFLGVHFTRRIDGSVEVGPNAVLALAREQYRGDRASWRDAREVLTYPGMVRLALRHWRAGTAELVRSRVRTLYARSARRLVPSVARTDLLRGGSGVRAQAVTIDGRLVDDFVFDDGPMSLHVLNAPSPAATASFAIGRRIAARALARLDGAATT